VNGIEIETFEAIFRESEGGGRVCVPILGSGVNLQAAHAENVSKGDDWEGLLRKVAARIAMSDEAFERLPTSNLAKWETMLRQCAMERGIEPFRAEGVLQKLVRDELREQERTTSHCRLYGAFLGARFHDIVSLNFDRRLALHSERETFRSAPKRRGIRAVDETIYRHSKVSHDGSVATHIWYPHGDTKSFSTLKFGVRKYGDYINGLERQRASLMAKLRNPNSPSADKTRLTLQDFDRVNRCTGTRAKWITWPKILLMSPLVFVGCSLAFDEWPLWWLLHQRARILATFDEKLRPPALYLHVGSLPSNLQGNPCDLRPVGFDSFEELWTVVCGTLSEQ
jgi:hypothetical protein